jgi:hypothetical protein
VRDLFKCAMAIAPVCPEIFFQLLLPLAGFCLVWHGLAILPLSLRLCFRVDIGSLRHVLFLGAGLLIAHLAHGFCLPPPFPLLFRPFFLCCLEGSLCCMLLS